MAGDIQADGNVTLYVNGKIAGKAKLPHAVRFKPSGDTSVGADTRTSVGPYGRDKYFKGAIDELVVYADK